jgi:UDP-N-acetylglucosamine 3-dehydrogenase
LKIGLIGAGFMGNVHLKAYARIPNVEVVGVVDVRPAAAKAGAELVGARPFSSYEDLVEEVDLIDICLPTPYHRDFAVRAARDGKHVVLEKPMARSLEEAAEMLEAFESSEGELFVAHVVRFFPEYVRLKRMVEEDAFGTIGVVRTSRKVPFLPAWNDWYADWRASGGLIVDMLIHDFDFLRWAFGEVERVYAKSIFGREFNRIDYALITLGFLNGTIAHVEGHWGYPAAFCYTTEIAGTRALATVESAKVALLDVLVQEGAVSAEDGKSPDSLVQRSPFQAELEHFIHCAKAGEKPVVSAQDAYEALRISLAAMKSAITEEPAKLC